MSWSSGAETNFHRAEITGRRSEQSAEANPRETAAGRCRLVAGKKRPRRADGAAPLGRAVSPALEAAAAHALHFDDIRIVAMLLRTDFDHAASRGHLFADCAMFAKKVVLTKRIRWFEDSNGSPSFNHCWMIWDRQHRGPPTLAYASPD
jgi:hypothetical protein